MAGLHNFGYFFDFELISSILKIDYKIEPVDLIYSVAGPPALNHLISKYDDLTGQMMRTAY